MIEQIKISDFELVSNFVLCKIDIDYDYVEIPGPDGTKVQLKIVDNTQMGENTKNIAITGTVLKTPERLVYNGDIKLQDKGKTIAGDEFESIMRSSLAHDTQLNVSAGDKVIYDYKVGVDGEAEGRLFKDEKIGYVMLIRYEMLYAKVVGEDLIPLNGWVFFLRDQKPVEEERESGLVVIHKTDKYESNVATVVVSGKMNKGYLDKGFQDPICELPEGTRVLIQRKFGHRIAYDLHAGKFKGIEACKRRNILAIFE